MTLRSIACVVLLMLSGLCASADDSAKGPARKLATPVEAAAAAERLAASGDAKGMALLAAEVAPDPWLVVDQLLSERAFETAAKFAAAAARPATEGLPAYIKRLSTREGDAEDRSMFAAVLAARIRSDHEGAIEAANDLDGAVDSVPRVRIRLLQGLAEGTLKRWSMAAKRLLEAAEGAEAIGWIATALPAYQSALAHARRHSNWALGVRALERMIVIHDSAGHRVKAAWAHGNLGLLYEKLAKYSEALAHQDQVLAMLKDHDELERALPVVLGNVGNVHIQRGDYEKAEKVLGKALALMLERGDGVGEARVRESLGVLREHQGQWAEALSILKDLRVRYREKKDGAGYARVVGNSANVLMRMGDYANARKAYEEALRVERLLPGRAGVATTLGNLAILHQSMGNNARAMTLYQRALDLKRELGDRAGAASTLASMGLLYLDLGDFARALRTEEQVLATMREIGDTPGIARVYVNLGAIHLTLGSVKHALSLHDEALTMAKRLGNRGLEAELLEHMGEAYLRQERYEESLRVTRAALALHALMGDKRGTAISLTRLGGLQHRRGKLADAIDKLKHAAKIHAGLGDDAQAAWVAYRIGAVLADKGDHDEALEHVRRAVREMRALYCTVDLMDALELLARMRLRRREFGMAIGLAREATRIHERALSGLAEIEGARLRERHADVYAVGVLAALALDQPEEALTFLEAGRGGSQLQALSASPTRLYVPIKLPPALGEAKAQAEAAHRVAHHRYRRALQRRDMPARRKRRAELRVAESEIERILSRIQREAGRQAAVLYPRPRTAREIRGSLKPQEALVLYGVCLDKALAIVVDRKEARFVELGEAEAIRKACVACKANDPTEKIGKAIEDLKRLLVDPLGLGKVVKRVIVSPTEFLSYVPYGALFSARSVVLTPSGTTHVHLRKIPVQRGARVLSLGAPEYGTGEPSRAVRIYRRGGALSPLPKSKLEAEAVGDVVLVGPEATEARFKEALATQRRWRAVHLACHGLVDPDRPVFSSLALTPSGDDDGFLTCYEILGLSIPADLVVLSACDTGTGALYRGEGIIGLTRAFMYAGTPRVLCSLWLVDDAATKALMTKFYELWNPKPAKDGKPTKGSKPAKAAEAPRAGLPAEEALRQAQAWVRDHKEWEHPYYWAAWVLWGLPDA